MPGISTCTGALDWVIGIHESVHWWAGDTSRRHPACTYPAKLYLHMMRLVRDWWEGEINVPETIHFHDSSSLTDVVASNIISNLSPKHSQEENCI